MKQTGILFKPEMIRAIQEGNKTMTRRIRGLKFINENPGDYFCDEDLVMDKGILKFCFVHKKTKGEVLITCPYGTVGDVLYVKESCYFHKQENRWFYKSSDILTDSITYGYKWSSPLFMLKAAARIFFEITNIRVEKACDISWEDAIKEGIKRYDMAEFGHGEPMPKEIIEFKKLWFKINGEETWNHFVWVLEFKQIENPNKV